MNRLIRIALTLFVSATILAVLVRQRLARIEVAESEVLPADYVRDETQMATLGAYIAVALAVTGVVLLVVAMVKRSRAARSRDD